MDCSPPAGSAPDSSGQCPPSSDLVSGGGALDEPFELEPPLPEPRESEDAEPLPEEPCEPLGLLAPPPEAFGPDEPRP